MWTFANLTVGSSKNLPLARRNGVFAAESGRVDVAQWLYHNGVQGVATTEELDFLKWLHVNGCPWSDQLLPYWLLHGRLQVLRMLGMTVVSGTSL